MNEKINTGVCAIASILGVIAGGMFLRSKLKNRKNDVEEIDKLAYEIDIFDEES